MCLACSPSPATSSEGDSTTSGPTGDCVAGQSIVCACVDGSMGAQVCLDDGSGYGDCDCAGAVTSGADATGVDASDSSGVANDSTGGGDTTTDSGGGTDSTSTDSTGDSTTGEVGVLAGWSFRRPVDVDNALPEVLADFQVKIDVAWDSDMATDFADLRFTAGDGITELPYWIERHTPLGDAEAWVRVPTIPAAGTTQLWMYYGNAAATDDSDGDATFFFFDDFSGAALDPAKWSATSDHTVGSGRLEVQTGAVYTNAVVVDIGQIMQTGISWTCCESGLNPFIITAISHADVNFSDLLRLQENGPGVQVRGQSQGDFFPDMTTVIQSGAFPLEEYGMGREFGIVHFIAYPFDAVSYPKLMPGPHYIVFGEEIGSTATNAALRDLWVDWVVVRTFAVVDPTTTVGAEESLP